MMKTFRFPFYTFFVFFYCLVISKPYPFHQDNEFLRKLFPAHVLSGHNHYKKLCPVSGSMRFEMDGYFIYPLDLFNQEALSIINDKITQNNATSLAYQNIYDKWIYNCTSTRQDTTPQPKHKCSIEPSLVQCPVIEDNIVDALRWATLEGLVSTHIHPHLSIDQPPYLYTIWRHLLNPDKKVRIFLIGGSATEGAGSEECYCNAKYDKRCQAFNQTTFTTTRPLGSFKDCCWFAYLIRYLRSFTHANLEIHDITQGGTHSTIATQMIYDHFVTNNIPLLTSQDLVFIDYSMNEALSYVNFQFGYQLEHGIERLIRMLKDTLTFHPHSKNNNETKDNEEESLDEALWPTIVMLSTWPVPGGWVHEDPMTLNLTELHQIDYLESYRKLTKHYSIPLISLRDAIWSNASRTKQAKIHAELITPDHPIWYQHLFTADVLANILHNEFHHNQEYTKFVTTKTVSPHTQLPYTEDELKALWISKQVLPKPLIDSPSVQESLCSTQGATLLSLSAEQRPQIKKLYNVTNNPHHMIGSFVVYPEKAWNIVDEGRGKYGWVSTFNHDEKDMVKEHHLIFFLDSFFSTDTYMKIYDSSDTYFVLLLSYLRTYKNAGQISMKLCGHHSQNNLDALWEAFETRKISTTEMFAGQMHGFSWEECQESYHQLVKTFNNIIPAATDNTSHPFIHIIHHRLDIGDGDDAVSMARTKAQKFKVSGIKICEAMNNKK